jgi:hypothetical protein
MTAPIDRFLQKCKEIRDAATPGPYTAFESGAWGSQGFGIEIGKDISGWLCTSRKAMNGNNSLFFAHAANNDARKDEMIRIAIKELSKAEHHSSLCGDKNNETIYRCDACRAIYAINELASG